MTTSHTRTEALIPPMVVAGRTFQHNAKKWRVCTNRHPEIDGRDWGWIEGADGDATWSNSKQFNYTAAHEVVRLHHEWLEHQKPLAIRIIEAREEHSRLNAAYVRAMDQFHHAERAYQAAASKLNALIAEAHITDEEQSHG